MDGIKEVCVKRLLSQLTTDEAEAILAATMTKLQMAEFIVAAIENGWLPLYLPEIVTGNAEQALVTLMGHEEMAQFIVDTVNNGMLTKENLGISD